MLEVNYEIVFNNSEEPLVIRDLGPWDKFMTVTNAAEEVVLELREQGLLPNGRGLFYYDSEGELTEIHVQNGKFFGFGPVYKQISVKEKA